MKRSAVMIEHIFWLFRQDVKCDDEVLQETIGIAVQKLHQALAQSTD